MPLELQLKEAREREADYRLRLSRHRDLSAKLRVHATMLRDALRDPAPGLRDIARLLGNVARLSSQALGIRRTSIWLFDESRKYLVCRFQVDQPTVGDGLRLEVASCPGYITALRSSDVGAVAVDDARQDPRTSELIDYLRANDVGALLDIPILGPGTLHGVVCHEHEGGPRAWLDEEVDFATDVGAMVALALEAERRVTAEKLARGAEARYQHLVESLPVTVYSFHAKTGQLDYLSPKIAELGGMGPDQYLVAGGIERWVQAIEPEDREPVRARLSGKIADGFSEELTYRIRLRDGSRRWVRDTCAVVRDATGRPVALQGTLADVTALQEAQLSRAELERRYRTLLENIDLLAVILGATGRVEFVNDCFVRLTGFAKGEALGADGFDLILPEPDRSRVRADFLEGMSSGRLVPRFETTVRTRTGASRRVLWTNTLIRSSAGAVLGCSSLGVDVTERLEAEAAELEHQKLESLGRLAATVAHDFNNLLTVIAGSVEVMGTPSKAIEARAEIDLAIKQGAGLTRSLLAYARREAISPTLMSVDRLVRSTLPMLSKMVEPGLTLSSAIDAPDVRVVMDETQFRQVLINLVSNAADAARGYGSQVSVSIHLEVLESHQARAKGLLAEGTFLVLVVADDGRGMTPELLERAFDPFFTTKAKGEGTGLGLSMCESIVRRAGGFISTSSIPGRGTSFRVYLPVAAVETEGQPQREQEPFAVHRGPKVDVLVLEDSEPIRTLVNRVLSGQGLRVWEAQDLKSARELLRDDTVDLLLTDQSLPDGDGLSFAQEMIERRLARQVILMSGDPEEAAYATAYAVLPKPFRLDVLIQTVFGALRAVGQT